MLLIEGLGNTSTLFALLKEVVFNTTSLTFLMFPSLLNSDI